MLTEIETIPQSRQPAVAVRQSAPVQRPEFQTVTMMGLGYIGLPTAAVIASRGIEVVGVDVKEEIVNKIASGHIHIYEPDLDGLVQKVVSSGTLVARMEPAESDVFIIAVPTPVGELKNPVLDYVIEATRKIAPVLRPGNLVILESTSPVGTTEMIANLLAESRPDLKLPTRDVVSPDINIAYCPERVLPGRILSELVNNDRCIGGITMACGRRAQRFYKKFVRGACIVTSARTAEIVKLTENAFRDANIAFANELSMICDKLAINVWDVIDLANRHPRVNILKPGPGVGGHCIAVDPWLIVHSAPELANVIRTARQTNDKKAHYTVETAAALIDEHPYAQVACFGLAFKANVDDLRESPALEVAIALGEKYGSRIKVVEPHIQALPEALAATGAEFLGLDDALAACEVGVVLVDHDEFRGVPTGARRHMALLDTRGIWRDSGWMT
jgi:UDP-N-acetyl-D-mannosaminuronic acid dehydrogenase